MGPITDRIAILDSKLVVHGLQGLRVIEASIMPKIPSLSTNVAAIMIAERGIIKEYWL